MCNDQLLTAEQLGHVYDRICSNEIQMSASIGDSRRATLWPFSWNWVWGSALAL